MARKRGLTAEDVVSAAARLADRDGLERLTLKAVADELGIRSPSLYAHVEGLEGLRRLLAIEGARRLADALMSAGQSGDEALAAFASATRAFSNAHPGLYDAAQEAVRPGTDDEVYEALQEPVAVIAAVLRRRGHREEEIIPLIRSLRSSVHGFIQLERHGGFGMPEDVDASFDLLVGVVVAGIGARLG